LQRIKQLETLVLGMAVWNNPWIAQDIEKQSKHFDYACLTEFFSETYVDNSYIDRWNSLNGSNGEVTGSDDVGFGGSGRAAKEANNRVNHSKSGSSHKRGASSLEFREFEQRHKCEHCGKKGHFASRCSLLTPGERNEYLKAHLLEKQRKSSGQLQVLEETTTVVKQNAEREEDSSADPEMEELKEDKRYLPVFAEYKALPFVGWLEDTWIFDICVVIFVYFIDYMQRRSKSKTFCRIYSSLLYYLQQRVARTGSHASQARFGLTPFNFFNQKLYGTYGITWTILDDCKKFKSGVRFSKVEVDMRYFRLLDDKFGGRRYSPNYPAELFEFLRKLTDKSWDKYDTEIPDPLDEVHVQETVFSYIAKTVVVEFLTNDAATSGGSITKA